MAIAIPTVTRLQDQHDVNVTPGAGVDEYALVYDHDTARFVLRTTAGYDHGLLNAGSLADDDHTQYGLLAGRAGGQTLYGGTGANDGISIHGTSDGTRTTSYVILQPTAGNVGIGTPSPVANLHIQANVGGLVEDGGYALLRIEDTTGATGQNKFDFLTRQGSNTLGIYDVYNAATRLLITGAGFVGIATVSPATRLDIDAGALTMAEMSAPAGAANKAMLYAKDSGGGKTVLCCKLGDDVEIVLATQT